MRFLSMCVDARMSPSRCEESNSRHPSLQFKKVGAFWSARVDLVHRCLAVKDGEDFIWVWIGSHGEYERILRGGK